MGLPAGLDSRLRLPLIVAPMLGVSGPELAAAACAAGVIGSFPAANARNTFELEQWLSFLDEAADTSDSAVAPYCVNLVMRHDRLKEQLEVLVSHQVELVITSVGPPDAVIDPLHAVGSLVFSDVATVEHARRAIASGADGLVLLSAGAGGQTGSLNPLAFVRAVRDFYEGPIVLAGGIGDGHALRAAISLGADLGYVGTAFIASEESRASDEHKSMLIASDCDDVLLTRAFTGLPTSFLRPSILAAGIDPHQLDESIDAVEAARLFGPGGAGPHRWRDLYSAGHSVSGVRSIRSAREIVHDLRLEFGGHPQKAASRSHLVRPWGQRGGCAMCLLQ